MTDIFEMQGIEVDKLGCIMAKYRQPLALLKAIPNVIVYKDEAKDIPGIETQSHVTLLFGLMKPGLEQMDVVDEALKDWKPDAFFTPSHISVFESDNPWDVVVLEPMYSGGFLKAHQALSRIPHVNAFPVYRPHMTLAYVHKGYGHVVQKILQKPPQRPLWGLPPLAYTGLDYGR